jgi:hypothetical protein
MQWGNLANKTMSTITKGTFTLDLGFVKLGKELSDADRQCAWEFYAEIATRVAVIGKRGDRNATNYDGELYSESLESLYTFFKESRKIMRQFPVGRIVDFRQEHLGILINRVLTNVLRPFLEKWNCRYRIWWIDAQKDKGSWFDLQKRFPELTEFLSDWTALRLIMRHVERTLARQYKLVPLE